MAEWRAIQNDQKIQCLPRKRQKFHRTFAVAVGDVRKWKDIAETDHTTGNLLGIAFRSHPIKPVQNICLWSVTEYTYTFSDNLRLTKCVQK